MIDIHNHIIPGIDDGADSLEQALAMLALAQADGIRKLVCTPHMHPGRFDNDLGSIGPMFEGFKKQARAAGFSIQLAMAAEVRFSDEMMFQLRRNEIPMIGQWDGFQCLLLEMPHQRIPVGMEQMLDWLYKREIRVVIAHPERNKELMSYPERVLPLVERGALLQLTAGSVAGRFGERAETTARWFVDQELVQFVASDAHHPVRRPSAMALAAETLNQWVGSDQCALLTTVNPDKLTQCLFGDAL
ncbi:tyrosine-protein phosphatase [Endozoicomonas acroporae]|uniref:tyrosine-protein phosphatase n=1 Tax=Endozoicomonas acroporae TaxID=1701104 RepID=UPI000C75D99D|nr:CpsB/CapC family capsule biosynthesis tyrosine phosphatase [Endozoicomonas acroporae]